MLKIILILNRVKNTSLSNIDDLESPVIYTGCGRNTSHLCSASELRQVVMVAPFR